MDNDSTPREVGSNDQLGAVSEARCYVHVHAPRWRDRRKARARQLFRCLKAGRRPTIEPAMQARIDAMASKLAPNVRCKRATPGKD